MMYEVEFFDRKGLVKVMGEVRETYYHTRIARVEVLDTKLIPLALRRAGYTPEKITKINPIQEG